MIRIGEQYLAEVHAAHGDSYNHIPHCYSGLHGIGNACAALGRVDDARDAFRRSREGSDAFNDQAVVEMNLWSEQIMVLIPYLTDRPDERRRLVADANRAWERCVGTTITVVGDGAPSELQSDLLEGRWQKARQLATDHLSAPWITIAQEAIVVLGILDHRQGRPDDAWRRVGQLLPDGPGTEPGNVHFAHAITAIALAVELALDACDLPAARDWINAHSRWQDWNGARLWRADTQYLLARYYEQAGDLRLAREHAEAALEIAGDPRQPLRIIAATRTLGQIAIRSGVNDIAEAHLNRALELATACVVPFERALTLLALAERRIATGKVIEARELLAEVHAICAPLDALPTLARATKLEQRTAPPALLAGLTAHEVEVLQLVASGRSNREIADTLRISPRTIERHIANIYLKIDAHNKSEATAYAIRHHLV